MKQKTVTAYTFQILQAPVHYWTLNLSENDRAVWVRASGMRAQIGNFGEFYVGRRVADSTGQLDSYAVTHPVTGRLVSRGTFASPEAAVDDAAAVLRRIGLEKTQKVIAAVPRYQHPALDPSQCDEVAVPALLDPTKKGAGRAASAQA